MLALFSVDEGDDVTVRGALHRSFAPVAFLGVAAAGVLSWQAQRGSTAWGGLARAPGAFAWALLCALASFGLLLAVVQFHDDPRSILGAAERMVVVGIAGWVLAEAVQGCRVAVRAPGPDPP